MDFKEFRKRNAKVTRYRLEGMLYAMMLDSEAVAELWRALNAFVEKAKEHQFVDKNGNDLADTLAYNNLLQVMDSDVCFDCGAEKIAKMMEGAPAADEKLRRLLEEGHKLVANHRVSQTVEDAAVDIFLKFGPWMEAVEKELDIEKSDGG